MENEITVKIPVQTKLQLCRSSTFSCAMWLNVGPGFKSTLIKSKTKKWRKRQKNSRSLFVFLYKKYLNFYIITWNIHSQIYGHSVQQPIIYMLTHFIRNEKILSNWLRSAFKIIRMQRNPIPFIFFTNKFHTFNF